MDALEIIRYLGIDGKFYTVKAGEIVPVPPAAVYLEKPVHKECST